MVAFHFTLYSLAICQRFERHIFAGTSSQSVGSDVGFFAYPSSNFRTKAKGTIIFDSVDRNEGGGYDVTTGIFTVAVGGLYHIYWNILSEGGTASTVFLKVDGNEKAKGYIAASQRYHTPSVSVYLRLNKGNKVFLQALNDGAILDSGRYSTFGGELVRY